MIQFDVILSNPPFQDRESRGKTPHKLWIEFTLSSILKWLKPDGFLYQVSPASFASPSSKVLKIMQKYQVKVINFDISHYFPGVGSSFAYYIIQNRKESARTRKTKILSGGKQQSVKLDESFVYLPNPLSALGISIHRKVMFSDHERLKVEFDYVTCHNILIHRADTLSKSKTAKHKYELLHTNSQRWFSSIRQPFSTKKKVMWSRSGYTKPFYDPGKLGVTDMGYFVVVSNATEGKALAHNLNSKLFQYIFKTAKWSGFGNEIVFSLIPKLPNTIMSDAELYEHFGITEEESAYITEHMG